jgi:hypothetical protein
MMSQGVEVTKKREWRRPFFKEYRAQIRIFLSKKWRGA